MNKRRETKWSHIIGKWKEKKIKEEESDKRMRKDLGIEKRMEKEWKKKII